MEGLNEAIVSLKEGLIEGYRERIVSETAEVWGIPPERLLETFKALTGKDPIDWTPPADATEAERQRALKRANELITRKKSPSRSTLLNVNAGELCRYHTDDKEYVMLFCRERNALEKLVKKSAGDDKPYALGLLRVVDCKEVEELLSSEQLDEFSTMISRIDWIPDAQG